MVKPLKKKAKTKAKTKVKSKTKAKTKPKSGPKRLSVKKAAKKKVSRKPARKASKTKRTAKKRTMPKPKRSASGRSSAAVKEKKLEKLLHIEPGPPAGSIPPVEEPTQHEEALGVVTHYYSHLGVAVVQVNKDSLKAGDQVHIKGHTTDIVQAVQSMEYEHQHVNQASAGQSVGIKVIDHVREHDIVYVIR